jgi:hypothetical protein
MHYIRVLKNKINNQIYKLDEANLKFSIRKKTLYIPYYYIEINKMFNLSKL